MIEDLKDRLTWVPFDKANDEHRRSGMVYQTAEGDMYLLGELNGGDTSGCGCCSDRIYPVLVADLFQLIESLLPENAGATP